MAGTRALFASLGASAALVATAALSLLAVSAVFAFGGWTEPPAASVRGAELVFAAPTQSPSDGKNATSSVQTAYADPIVAAPPVRRPSRSDSSRAGDRPAKNVRAAGEPATRKPAGATQAPPLDQATTRPVAPTPAPAVAAPRKGTGDAVRKVGEDLSSTVQNTGTALAQATAPLAAPISTAVQEVFNAVAALLTQTTQGLGGALDKLLPPKK